MGRGIFQLALGSDCLICLQIISEIKKPWENGHFLLKIAVSILVFTAEENNCFVTPTAATSTFCVPTQCASMYGISSQYTVAWVRPRRSRPCCAWPSMHCMVYVRINGKMPTVTIGLKPGLPVVCQLNCYKFSTSAKLGMPTVAMLVVHYCNAHCCQSMLLNNLW